MAKITASASGTNRYRATPDKKNIGMNTMQMQSVETNAGTAICCAPSRIACTVSFPGEVAVDVLDLHRGVVHQDADRQGEAAERHDVDGLAESAQAKMLTRIDRGMEIAMMRVLLQLPRKSRIMIAVRHAAMRPLELRRSMQPGRRATDRTASSILRPFG